VIVQKLCCVWRSVRVYLCALIFMFIYACVKWVSNEQKWGGDKARAQAACSAACEHTFARVFCTCSNVGG
jgi:hypothetical protein